MRKVTIVLAALALTMIGAAGYAQFGQDRADNDEAQRGSCTQDCG